MKKFKMPMASIINSIRYIHINVGTSEFAASWAKSLIAATQRGLSNIGLLKQRPNGVLDGATEAALNKAFPPFGNWRRMTWFNILSGLAQKARVQTRDHRAGVKLVHRNIKPGLSGLGNYVSEHALYGSSGDYVAEHALMGLGDDSAQYGSYMQTQMNVAAGYLGLAKIAVDGKPGPATLALLNAIYDKTKNVVAQDPITSIQDMKDNCKVVGDFIRNSIVPAIKSPSSVTFQPINITGRAPVAAKPAAKPVATAFKFVAPSSSSGFLTKKILGLPLWMVLAGGGALTLVLMRSGRRAPAPAPAALPAPAAIPKGV
jgi:hypothetical protein